MALIEEVEEADVESLGALKEHYAKGKDGKYRPVGKDGKTLVAETKLLLTLDKEKALRKAAEDKLNSFAEISDPAAALDAMRKVEEMKGWTPEGKVKEQIKVGVQEVVTAHQKELQKRELREKFLHDRLHETIVESKAREAMANLKIAGEDAEALYPHVMKGLRMVEDAGRIEARVFRDDGSERSSDEKRDGSPMGIEEYVTTFRTKFPKLFPGTGSSGGGAGGGSAGGGSTPLPGGILKIKNSDYAMKAKHMADIGTGKAIVVDD